MYQLNVTLKNDAHTIFIEQGISRKLTSLLNENKDYSHIFFITQQSILDHVDTSFLSDFSIIIIGEKETSKSIGSAESVVQQLIAFGCDRDSLLVGFGGGTVTDLVGFVASIFMRGIDHIFIPTTLLGMVDSAIGGKTAVNSSSARNVIGTFKQPRAIYIDPLFLTTLPSREVIDGFAEIIKYGLIVDCDLYNMIESNFQTLIDLKDLSQIESIIQTCCQHKVNFVIVDELDQNQRMKLNFGHTLGHALESYFNYKTITHGQAVYYGMLGAAFISKKYNFLSEDAFNRVHAFISTIPKLNFNNMDCNKVFECIKYDKKKTKNKFNFIVLTDIGKADIFYKITSDDFKEAINYIANYEYSCN